MRGIARRAFMIGAYLVVAAVLVQFLLAGLGVFDAFSFFFWHATVNAAVVGLLPLLLVPVGLLGRVPGRLLGLAAAIFGLVIVQSLLLVPYHTNAQGVLRAVSGLHVLNALLILWVALQLLDGSRRLGRPGAEPVRTEP
jgi:Family of unknown function (DUF6220)